MLQIRKNINSVIIRKLCDVRYYATGPRKKDVLKKMYETLGVAEDCDDETLRLAFVYLVKKFHPDSGTNEASSSKFSEIESAYRKIQRSRSEEKDQDEAKPHADDEFDIKHTAPQHRHYLVYNVGHGSMSARQKLYEAQRAQKAATNVIEHRLKKMQATENISLADMDKSRAKNIKTQYGIDRLVEDLIQEAMNKGEFDNLRGMGKPLNTRACEENPYVDFTTHKLNKIMIDNGFTPEWIQLSKEVRDETQGLKIKLKMLRNTVGLAPLNYGDEKMWKKTLEKLKPAADAINKKIDKYNLLVPILQKQMLRVDLTNLANDALNEPPVN